MKLLKEVREGVEVKWLSVSEKHGHTGTSNIKEHEKMQHGQSQEPKPEKPPEPGKEWAQDEKGSWVQVTKGFASWATNASRLASYLIGPPTGCGSCGKKP